MQRIVRPALSVLLVAAFALPAWAQPKNTLQPHLFKNGRRVLQSFKPIVAKARQATVRILIDNKDKALGAVVDPAGFIMTKASELNGEITVRLPDGDDLEAEVVGVHKQHDLAMIKVKSKEKLQSVQFSKKAYPTVGNWVVTVGRSEWPIAIGNVSTPQRTIARVGGFMGVGIGPDKDGVAVTQVHRNSGAEKAGLKAGDVITAVDGKKVKDLAHLRSMVTGHDPGYTIKVTYLRDGEEKTVSVVLRSQLAVLSGTNRGARQQLMGGPLSGRLTGFPAVLQHDTVLRPQDVGGPLVDLKGEVIGLNIARAGRVESYAVPADVIRKLIPQMKAGRFKPESASD